MPTPSEPESALAGSRNGWISPDGEYYPVGEWGHDSFAYHEHDCSSYQLARRGWIKITGNDCLALKGTQAQLNTLFDWERANSKKLHYLPFFEVL